MELNSCFEGDVITGLTEMLTTYRGKIQTCVTSPPYFGLRDYGMDEQIGLENTVEEYVSKLVAVFDVVKELLADDGTLWLNLGDSYSGSGKGRYSDNKAYPNGKQSSYIGSTGGQLAKHKPTGHLKPKDLIGIPWRVAFALQEAGWYLRQDIIWHKPNPMPESVKDRCVKAHEYIFLLSKSRHYFFDHSSIQEVAKSQPTAPGKRSKRDSFKRDNAKHSQPIPNQVSTSHRPERLDGWDVSKRNKRSVWTVSTKPDRVAHFATFPTDLIEPCVTAGSRHGDIVLDPFMGSGTTAAVAQKLGRNWLGCELNPAYIEIQKLKTGKLELCS